MKCKFGYNGIIRKTVSDFKGYIQKCVEINDINNKDAHNLDGNCDLTVQYQGYSNLPNEL